jgi:hypothetical protein
MRLRRINRPCQAWVARHGPSVHWPQSLISSFPNNSSQPLGDVKKVESSL